ncbi:unnamed protein product [Caenorhabditis sp. 36 PRJEB53466]|nr:unnamed protein product [Caenorhabditis sp. 36 PRJEB53466]
MESLGAKVHGQVVVDGPSDAQFFTEASKLLPFSTMNVFSFFVVAILAVSSVAGIGYVKGGSKGCGGNKGYGGGGIIIGSARGE